MKAVPRLHPEDVWKSQRGGQSLPGSLEGYSLLLLLLALEDSGIPQ